MVADGGMVKRRWPSLAGAITLLAMCCLIAQFRSGIIWRSLCLERQAHAGDFGIATPAEPLYDVEYNITAVFIIALTLDIS